MWSAVLVRAVPALQRGAAQRGVLAAAAAAGAAAEEVQRRNGEDHAARAHAAPHALLLRAMRASPTRPPARPPVRVAYIHNIIITISPQFTAGHRPLQYPAISLDLRLLASSSCQPSCANRHSTWPESVLHYVYLDAVSTPELI
jgi:hypothetical protein